MQNTLILIGFIGMKKCYLNITKEEAIERYCAYMSLDVAAFNEDSVEVIEFDDEFEAYDVWSCAQ